MGLFRSKARKNREKAADGLLEEQTTTVTAQAVTAQAEVSRREVTAESRPDPDRPGWGRTIGLEIGKARGDRGGQD